MLTPDNKDAASISPNSIRMSENLSSIAAAMCAIQAELKPIVKTGMNTQQNYKYAKFEDFVEHVRDILSQHDLFLVTTTSEPKRLEPRQTRNGNFQYVVEVRITVRIIHKSGEWMEIDCYGEGQDTGDKAIYKAVTGGRKYALACLLGLSTTDDPENDDDEEKPKNNYRASPPRTSPPPKQQHTQNAKPATPPPQKSVPPEQGGITYNEVMNGLRNAKTVKELIEAYDFRVGLTMTEKEKADLVALKDKMKLKVKG